MFGALLSVPCVPSSVNVQRTEDGADDNVRTQRLKNRNGSIVVYKERAEYTCKGHEKGDNLAQENVSDQRTNHVALRSCRGRNGYLFRDVVCSTRHFGDGLKVSPENDEN